MQEPLDSADLDALIELDSSPGYFLVTERINEELQRRRDALERRQSEEETAFVRGYIAALRTVLTIRPILREEIKASLRNK